MANQLISYCLTSYNRRDLVRSALKSAYAQTYRPLEILILDDCSTDGTWEVIGEFIKNTPKPDDVTLVVKRNEKNLGNLGNWLKMCQLAHGDLLVKADCDDISLPERTAELAQKWKTTGATVVVSGVMKMSLSGRSLGPMKKQTVISGPLGAAAGYDRKAISGFPAVTDSEVLRWVYDDALCNYRALLSGKVAYVERPLVWYRIGDNISTGASHYREFMIRGMRVQLVLTKQKAIDAKALGLAFDESIRGKYQTLLALWDGKAFKDRFCAFRACRTGGMKSLIIGMILLLPRGIADFILETAIRAHYLWLFMRFGRTVVEVK